MKGSILTQIEREVIKKFIETRKTPRDAVESVIFYRLKRNAPRYLKTLESDLQLLAYFIDVLKEEEKEK